MLKSPDGESHTVMTSVYDESPFVIDSLEENSFDWVHPNWNIFSNQYGTLTYRGSIKKDMVDKAGQPMTLLIYFAKFDCSPEHQNALMVIAEDFLKHDMIRLRGHFPDITGIVHSPTEKLSEDIRKLFL